MRNDRLTNRPDAKCKCNNKFMVASRHMLKPSGITVSRVLTERSIVKKLCIIVSDGNNHYKGVIKTPLDLLISNLYVKLDI